MGCSVDPFLNCPLMKTAQEHGEPSETALPMIGDPVEIENFDLRSFLRLSCPAARVAKSSGKITFEITKSKRWLIRR